MDDKERQTRIAYAEKQFAIYQAYASYWQAMATTGAAKLRDISQGVKEGGWRQLTDEEKTQNALDAMRRHIHSMAEINDVLDNLRRGKEME